MTGLAALAQQIGRDWVEKPDGFLTYWVVLPTVRHCRDAQLEMIIEHLDLPDMECAMGLIYVNRRLAIFFYSNRELNAAPASELDGVLLDEGLFTRLPEMQRRLASRRGSVVWCNVAVPAGQKG